MFEEFTFLNYLHVSCFLFSNRYAFLLFRTDTQAADAAKEYEDKKLMLDGHRLAVLTYRQPEENLPRG